MENHKNNKQIQNKLYWIFGFFFSFFFAWGTSIYFSDTIAKIVWDSDIEKYVVEPGTVKNRRGEGWGTSIFGKHGIQGIEDIKARSESKVAIWGDSHVQAFEVDDNQKIPQVFTRKCKKSGFNNILAYGIGEDHLKLTDHYFNIPLYEAIAASTIAHFIVVADITDLYHRQIDSYSSYIEKTRSFSIIRVKKSPPRFSRLKDFFIKYKLDFLAGLLSRGILHQKVRLSPGFVKAEIRDTENVEKINFSPEALRFLLRKMKQKTNLPIVIVYCPKIPLIKNGAINYSDPNRSTINRFFKICVEYNIDYIDLTDSFLDNFKQTGLFPRGFVNSYPSKGHFNSIGHQLIAEAIFDYLKRSDKIKSAVHSN